jgi:D-alanyl-D-alanine carboxypeptidase/D-alanyl-D-alanine-endopeptidase (penicillin-binding protein 4)
MNHKFTFFFTFFTLLLLYSCGSSKKNIQVEQKKYFSGLYVFNPTKNDIIIDTNSDKYFTPASTVKLFTLYTALRCLPDSIATISYYKTDNELYIKPMADPSFLYDSLPNTTYNFLKNAPQDVVCIPDDFSDFVYGDGWQWDDYQYYYMPEKSLFPMYGNIATIEENTISPNYFQNNLVQKDSLSFYREFFSNVFYISSFDKNIEKRKIPFKTSFDLSIQLLRDTLQKPIYISNNLPNVHFTPYISTPTYPIYKRLMDESENFLAEQIFLIIAKQKTNRYEVKKTINYALDSLITNIPHKPRWVDASGLSRYNLFTPKSMVYLLQKMYDDFGEEKLFDLLPKNGKNGRLQKWYPFETTYLYAKTGSVSNNHSLCGFIKTKKGSLLIFSYMNNNYMENSSDIRATMNNNLQYIYNTY